MRRVLFTLVGLAIATSVAAAQTPDPAKVAAGQKVYEAQKCSTCHAIKGQGGKLSTALDGVAAKLPETDIKKWLTDPAAMETKLTTKPKMPMSTYMKTHKLTDADVQALVAYLATLK